MAKPPLFRVDAPARGKKPAAKIYALDEGELEATLDKLRKEGARAGSWSISRFKGLGEMNAEQLWETTLNPDTRRLLPVAYGSSVGLRHVAACSRPLERALLLVRAAAFGGYRLDTSHRNGYWFLASKPLRAEGSISSVENLGPPSPFASGKRGGRERTTMVVSS